MTKSQPPKSLVLYADDDKDDIELIREAFREHAQNVELLTFADGFELLEHLNNLDPFQPGPCLFILDINMPRLNGKDTLRLLRDMDEYSDVPAVLFSTSTLPADAAFANRHNAGFITKPLTSDQVGEIIDEMVDHCSDDVKKAIRRRGNNER